MKTIFLSIILSLFNAYFAQADEMANLWPTVENTEVLFWNLSKVSAETRKEILSLKPSNPGDNAEIKNLAWQNAILAAYDLPREIEVIDLFTGKNSKHRLTTFYFNPLGSGCGYKYPLAGATLLPSPDLHEKKDSKGQVYQFKPFYGLVLYPSNNLIAVPTDVTTQIEAALKNNPDCKQTVDACLEPAKVIGVRDAKTKKEYFITDSRIVDMNPTFFIFEKYGSTVKKVSTLEFPSCGS